MWNYLQPTEITFGSGARRGLAEAVARVGARPMVVTGKVTPTLPTTAEMLAALGPGARLFSEVEPNPTVASVDRLVGAIREHGSDVVVAIGGGSALDAAKVAAAVAVQGGPTRRFHTEGAAFDDRHLPLIAVPTTAGTGSEVTPVAVLDDSGKGIKAPLAHRCLYPVLALVDPELTLSMSHHLTACTGLDTLSHALEAYWTVKHQPICDAMALEAGRLTLAHLPRALEDRSDLAAREGMSLASLTAGLAFQVPRCAAVHACSYPLSNRYHLPHGAACAMTLDHFARYNAPAMGERGTALARGLGFVSMDALADTIVGLKRAGGLPATLGEIGVRAEDLDALVDASFHPVIGSNARPVTREALREMYLRMM